MAASARESSSRGVLAGLDIGGTKIGVCIGNADGRVLASAHVPVDHAMAPARLLDACAKTLAELCKGHGAVEISSLGCACPGPFDYRRQRFINPPNNPRWHGFELGAYLARRFSFPHAIMNDANAAALAEWLWGAARGTRTAIFLTMSTGMGCGLIIDGRLYEGPLGLAGEIGQIRLTPGDAGPVGFGKRGSVEGYTSGPGMQQMAHAEALVCKQLQKPTRLLEVLERHGSISTKDLCELSVARDAAARRVTDRVSAELGRLCSILVDVLNPDVIALGTIATAYPKLFIPGAMRVVRAESIPQSARRVRIRPSGFSPGERGDRQALAVAVNLLAG